MKKPFVLGRIRDVMLDGEERSVRRVAYLANTTLPSVHTAIKLGLLIKVGELPKSHPTARRGMAVVKLNPERVLTNEETVDWYRRTNQPAGTSHTEHNST